MILTHMGADMYENQDNLIFESQSENINSPQNKNEKRNKADYYTRKNEPLPWIYIFSRDWMGRLPDETFVEDI